MLLAPICLSSHNVLVVSTVSGSPALFHIGTNCIPHITRGKARHMCLCPSFHPLSFFKVPVSLSHSLSPNFQSSLTLHLSCFPSTITSSIKRVKRRITFGVVFGGFSLWWRRAGQGMARSRVQPKVWLWRAVIWPVAHISTLFGLTREARSNRGAGRPELTADFIYPKGNRDRFVGLRIRVPSW